MDTMALEENEDGMAIDNDEEERVDEHIPIWTDFSGRQAEFPFTGKSGLLTDHGPTSTPIDAFHLFVDEEVLEHLTKQTNIYAAQVTEKRLADALLSPNARHQKWTPTTKEEIKSFLGVVLWMGLDRKGTIASYWSMCPLYKNEIAHSTVSRNRFELLLNCIHFANNEEAATDDRLAKIQPLIDILLKKYQAIYCPGTDVVIDETFIPWRGRQYIPNKAHKYGVNLFKLCSTDGFTYNLAVYSGKSKTGIREIDLAKKVCEKLMHGLLNEGRTLYVNNFYTSYELAKSFLDKNTHVVGTVRASKKKMPISVMLAKLNRGEMIAREEQNGIVVLKWKETRDVRILSTRHKPILVETRHIATETRQAEADIDTKQQVPGPSNAPRETAKRRCFIRERESRKKPEAVIAYNKGKSGIGLSDQMASYATTLKKGVKWYRKLGLELLLGLSVVNAHVIYQNVTGQKMKIRDFRESIARSLLKCEQPTKYAMAKITQIHILKSKINEKTQKLVNRSCKICYQGIKAEEDRNAARKKNVKSNYFCAGCDGEPYMCVSCFSSIHEKK